MLCATSESSSFGIYPKECMIVVVLPLPGQADTRMLVRLAAIAVNMADCSGDGLSIGDLPAARAGCDTTGGLSRFVHLGRASAKSADNRRRGR